MKKIAFAVAACLALAGFGAADDAAVANRKWVRAQIATALKSINATNHVYTGSLVASTSNSWTYASTMGGDADYTLRVTFTTPEYPALFVAWSTTNGVPAYTKYAKVPGADRYVNVSNAFLSAIEYTVTNWVETTNFNGTVATCARTRTTWSATDAGGGRWATTYVAGQTALALRTDPSRYFVIQATTVSEKEKAKLLGNLLANAAAAPPFFRLSPFLSAYAEPPPVEVERGSGTLGYHEAIIAEITLSIRNKTGTFYVIDEGDHQYDPYGGVDHASLEAGEEAYRSWKAVSDPENWGFSFPLSMQNENGQTVYITKKQFMESDSWLDAAERAFDALPEPNKAEEPEIDDPTEHICKVYEYDQEGNARHVGCVCDWPNCKYCPSCETEYTVTKRWSNGYKEETKKHMRFVGAEHNWKSVAYGALQGGGDGYAEYDGGCQVCFAGNNSTDGTHFCGDGSKNNLQKDHDYTSHQPNEAEVTGRDECGCMCRKYWASAVGSSSTPPMADQHVMSGGGESVYGQMQDSSCWCLCRRKHQGPFGDNEESCPGHCHSCGCYKTYDGADVNGVHPEPLEYRITDDGELPDSLDGHNPSESDCGCKCRAISPDNPDTYPLMKEVQAFHHVENDGCTCMCQREFHVVNNDTGHCPEVCTLCGFCNKPDAEGVMQKAVPTYADHAQMAGHCGCQCYYYGDGWAGEASYCGFKGTEDGVRSDKAWHAKRDATHCCCECGEYADHAAHNLDKMADLFTPGECENVCKGINSYGQRCNKVLNANRSAYWYEHDAAATGCGCKCHAADGANGFSGTEEGICDAAEYHHRESGTCHCVCGGNDSHHSEWFMASACPRICSSCGKLEDGTEPAMLDHTAKPEGCGCLCGEMDSNAIALEFHNGHGLPYCRCDCGMCHRWYSAGGCRVCTLCGMTEGLALPTDEALHTVNPDSPAAGYWYTPSNMDGTNHVDGTGAPQDCTCYCGYYSHGTHTTENPDLHHFTGENAYGTKNCTCDGGEVHVFREWTTYAKNQRTNQAGVFCPVCAYCRAVKKGPEGAAVAADEEDHVPKDKVVDGTKCGCKCGLLDTSATLEKFHPCYPGKCQCYGTDGDGTGSWHYNKERSDCTAICSFEIDGAKHLKASCAYNHAVRESLVAATEADHTKRTGACGCRCGEYTSSNIGASSPLHVQNPSYCGCHCRAQKAEHKYLSHPTDRCYSCYCGDVEHKVHVQNPNGCGCYCGQSSKSGHHRQGSDSCLCYCGETTMTHKYASGSCWCYCNTIHGHATPHLYCNRVCTTCGCLVDNSHQVATVLDHTPKGSGCGCACGAFGGSAYDYATHGSYHGGSGSPSCMCQCGAGHKNFTPKSGCPNVCAYCSLDRARVKSGMEIHTWPDESCDCGCGDYTDHRFSPTSCTCYCRHTTRPHLYAEVRTQTGTYTCPTCGNDITCYHSSYTCSRCGDQYELNWELGHAYNCGDESSDGTHVDEVPSFCDGCGCGLNGTSPCYCNACTNKRGTCSTCGKKCGAEQGGGDGGGNDSEYQSQDPDDIL